MPSLADIPDNLLNPPAPEAFKIWLFDRHLDQETAFKFMRIFSLHTDHQFDGLDFNQLANRIAERDAR